MAREQHFPLGRFTEARKAWLTLGIMEVILYQGRTEGDLDEEYWELSQIDTNEHKPIRVSVRFTRSRQRTMHLNLTAMTEQELVMFREFVNDAIDMALPTCRALDQRAKKAWEDGDDAWARSYRPDPTLVRRQPRGGQLGEGDDPVSGTDDGQREQSQHDQSIPERREGAGEVLDNDGDTTFDL